MKHKFFATLVACAFLLNAANFVFADTKANKNKSKAAELAAVLPASDMVAVLDVKRFINSALPQILSGNKAMLDEINGKADEFKTKTGLDVRQFEYLAVGVNAKKVSDKDFDFEPVVLARGNYNPETILSAAKLASNGKYREEKIGARAVYIFSYKEYVEKNKSAATAGSSKIQEIIDSALAGLPDELAVTVYDANTLAFGTLNRVRETLEAKTRVEAQLAEMINRKPTAVMNFAANLPNGLSDYISLADDQLGRNLASVRQLYGTMDVVGENTLLQVSAKTQQTAQAEELKTSLSGLQQFFAPILLGQKGENKKVYGRVLQNLKISRAGNEVIFDIQVPQTDINLLIGAK